MKSMFLIFSLILSNSLFSETLEHQAGKVECNETIKVCTYVVRNVDAGSFVARINNIMFPPGVFLNPEDGFFHADGPDKVLFYFKGGAESEVYQRFIGLIPMIDSFDDFDSPAFVQVSVEIYSITDSGLSDLSFETARYAEENSTATTDSGALLEFAVDVGSKILKSIFATQKKKQQINRLTRVTQIIPNKRSINFSHTTKLYVSPNSVTTKEETPGLVLNTGVSINRNNNDIVELRDFMLKYGVQNKNVDGLTSVTTLDFTLPEIQIVKNRSIVLVSSQTIEVVTNSGIEFGKNGFSAGKGGTTSQAKLLLLTSARPISIEELTNPLTVLDGTRSTFNKNEVELMPDHTVSNNELFSAIEPFTIITATNDRYLMFRLNKNLASKNNIKKNVTVKISGGGIKQEQTLTVEELMLKGFKFNDLPAEALNDDLVEFDIKLSEFYINGRGWFKSHNVSWQKSKVIYSNSLNKFLK